MKSLLEIRTSLYGAEGQSSRLAERFVTRWRAQHPYGLVTVRDLSTDSVPHLTAERFGAFLAKPDARSPLQQAIVAESDALIDELRAADVVVFGLPMYNFAVPSTLKAYFDHVARAGVTFRYTANGQEGLLKGKKVYVFATRGGLYLGTPRDTQTAYVREFLGFLGITDVEFVYAEGLSLGEAPRAAALADASLAIDQLSEPERKVA